MKAKKKEGLSCLFEIAGQKKGLLVLAGLLSAGSAVCMLVPYWAIYEILKELLSHGGNPPGADGEAVIRWGWTAFGGLVGGLVLLYAALMSSHVAAFRILYGLRVRLSEHIGKLPLGYLSNTSTGAIKKTMEQNVEKIEGFIAHTIPDLVNVVATVAVMLAVFFSLDVWLALVCLVVVVLSLFLQFSNFMGKRAKEFMATYYDVQEKMSASAVQYVRNARGEDFRTECPLVSSVQRRDSGLQDLCLEVLRHIPERDDSFYRPAQFTGDVHSSYGYFVDTSQSAVAFVGGGVAIFHHHGTWHDFASLLYIGKETCAGTGASAGACRLRCGIPPCVVLL